MEEATKTFQQLKNLLTTMLVLIYSDFLQLFVFETNICNDRVGAVLLQQQHLVAYFSWKLSSLRQQASMYTRELWAIME